MTFVFPKFLKRSIFLNTALNIPIICCRFFRLVLITTILFAKQRWFRTCLLMFRPFLSLFFENVFKSKSKPFWRNYISLLCSTFLRQTCILLCNVAFYMDTYFMISLYLELILGVSMSVKIAYCCKLQKPGKV